MARCKLLTQRLIIIPKSTINVKQIRNIRYFAHIGLAQIIDIMHNHPKIILTVRTLNIKPVKSAARDAGSACRVFFTLVIP